MFWQTIDIAQSVELHVIICNFKMTYGHLVSGQVIIWVIIMSTTLVVIIISTFIINTQLEIYLAVRTFWVILQHILVSITLAL